MFVMTYIKRYNMLQKLKTLVKQIFIQDFDDLRVKSCQLVHCNIVEIENFDAVKKFTQKLLYCYIRFHSWASVFIELLFKSLKNII